MEEAEAHLLPAADVLRRFSVTAEGGLSPEQVTGARERYGPNGESAGHAGAAGAACAAVSVSLPAPRLRRGPLPSQPSAPAGGRAGSEGSGNLCRCPWGSRRGCAVPSQGKWGCGFRVRRPDAWLPCPALLPPGPGTRAALPGFPPPPASQSTLAGPRPPPSALSAASPRRRSPPESCRCTHRGRPARDQPGTLRLSLLADPEGLPRGLSKTPRRCNLSAGRLGDPTPRSSSFCNPRRMWLAESVGALNC